MGVGMIEKIVSQLGGVAAGFDVEQVPEALKLVKDHEVRFKRLQR